VNFSEGILLKYETKIIYINKQLNIKTIIKKKNINIKIINLKQQFKYKSFITYLNFFFSLFFLKIEIDLNS
jgi:hypothetical protein